MKKVVQLVVVFILAAQAVSLFAADSTTTFTTGKRAFDLGKYSESVEILSGFIAAWPDHELVNEAKRIKLTARARTINDTIFRQNHSLYSELSSELEALRQEYSDKELREPILAVQYAAQGAKEFSWENLKNFSNQDLIEVLRNKWHPEPFSAPIKVLEFVNFHEKNCKNHSDPELLALINYLKAQSLWQLLLSPLSLEANARILKAWGDWPVHDTLDQALRTGFNFGSPDIKKNVALLGFHFDCFRHKGVVSSSISSGLNSRWLSYLSERGINLQEAWCPR